MDYSCLGPRQLSISWFKNPPFSLTPVTPATSSLRETTSKTSTGGGWVPAGSFFPLLPIISESETFFFFCSMQNAFHLFGMYVDLFGLISGSFPGQEITGVLWAHWSNWVLLLGGRYAALGYDPSSKPLVPANPTYMKHHKWQAKFKRMLLLESRIKTKGIKAVFGKTCALRAWKYLRLAVERNNCLAWLLGFHSYCTKGTVISKSGNFILSKDLIGMLHKQWGDVQNMLSLGSRLNRMVSRFHRDWQGGSGSSSAVV